MITLLPKEGFKLYDGSTISEGIYAPDNADLSIWKEITNEEALAIQKKQEEEMLKENEAQRS